MGSSSSHEVSGGVRSHPHRTDEADYHIALVQDCKETAEAYIDHNRDYLKLASAPQPWWSNRLIHRSFMVKRKMVELQRFMQRLGTREAFVKYRDSMRSQSDYIWSQPKSKFTDEERIAADLWHHSKTPKGIETALEHLEDRIDDFLGLYQEEKQSQLV